MRTHRPSAGLARAPLAALLLTLLPGLLLAAAAGSALADPPQPSRGQTSPELIAAARLEAQRAPLAQDPATWEDVEGMAAEGLLIDGLSDRANDDNDTAHYGRGSTLIIHIFISHDGGTWGAADMDAANAKAEVAKEYYTDNAPYGANLSFDGQGTGQYWYYHADLPYTIPYSGTDGTVVEDALAAIGWGDGDGDGTRIDDMTMYLQNWNGGYDNVIASFQSYVNGRAWASYGTAQIRLYLDSNGNVWAHEMGHSFGACDEYVEGGQCNGGIDCGLCQSWYLDYDVNNGNCQLATCPIDVSCLMINNTFTNICDYTRQHWAWWDGNNDSQLDIVERRVLGNTFTNIWELWHNGYFYWNNVDQGEAMHQHWNTWSVVGLRSPATADYDPYLYLDNNHNNYVANSYTGYPVDFIVGDYNHNRPGNEHIAIQRYTGDTANYNLTFESGTGMLYPDGISRSVTWYDYNIVRVWDVPLFAGEELTFYGWNVSAGVDIGLALFKSNGTTYFAGRTSAVAVADAYGAGSGESFTYTVPADDVYGLVAWTNSSVDGSFEIQIGPTPYTLVEESPFLSALSLRLFNYDPNAIYWSVVGTRAFDGTDVLGYLYADQNYTSLLEASTQYIPGSAEFVAADYYYAPYNRDYWRVVRNSGAGNHYTEWEHDPELLAGYTGSMIWDPNHVAKIWDFYGTSGQNYFFREYQSDPDLDTALYLYSSHDGDYYKRRGAFTGLSNYHPPADGGEWFNATAPANGWLGFVVATEDENGGGYSVMAGPDIVLSEDVADSRYDELVFASHTVPWSWWTVFGARPDPGAEASVWLYGDDAYTIGTLAVSDQTGPGVAFVVGDYNHIGGGGTVYPRFWRRAGYGALDLETESGGETLSFNPGGAYFYDLDWPAGDVVEIWDLWLWDGDQVHLKVEDLTRGSLDFGVALFSSNGAAYYASQEGAAAGADAQGVGGTEFLDFTADHSDWYGLVVYNQNDAGGAYRITVQDATTVAVDGLPLPERFGLRPASANPFAGEVTLSYSLPMAGTAAIDIFDVSGRRVRGLLDGAAPAGRHLLVWDGKNDAGELLPGGVYLARLRAGGESHSTKLVRVR